MHEEDVVSRVVAMMTGIPLESPKCPQMSKIWVFGALRMEPADAMAPFGFPWACDTG